VVDSVHYADEPSRSVAFAVISAPRLPAGRAEANRENPAFTRRGGASHPFVVAPSADPLQRDRYRPGVARGPWWNKAVGDEGGALEEPWRNHPPVTGAAGRARAWHRRNRNGRRDKPSAPLR
jgi:hypothetical protein